MDINATETFEYWLEDTVEYLIADLPNTQNVWHCEVYNEGLCYDDMFELSVRKQGNHLYFSEVRCLVPPRDYDIFDAYFDENEVAEAHLVSLVFSHFKKKGFASISYQTKNGADDILAALKKAGFNVSVAIDTKQTTTLTVST